jgi:lysozyme
MIPKQHRKKAAVGALAVGLVAGGEGLRTVAYKDPVGIPTICFGETKGVKMGDRKTPEECQNMLEVRLEEFYGNALACLPELENQGEKRKAAHISLIYNIGAGAYCKSSVVRLAKAGYWKESCDAFLKFRFAKGIPLPGLTNRRNHEREYCLAPT